MKVLISGDTHGRLDSVYRKIDHARANGIQRIVILGDFGLWWGHDGVVFLDDINEYAIENHIQIFALPGNHECHELWDHLVTGAYEAQATSHGWAYVRSNVLLSPKTLFFKWGGRQFAIAGGAVSIDKEYRLEYERQKGKKVWSPNEQLTDAQVDSFIHEYNRLDSSVDVLLTHDCSDRTPFRNRLKPDWDSAIHRERIDRVLGALQPELHFHGHMHEAYNWQNRVGNDDLFTQTYGLTCDNEFNSWGILDLSTLEFTFETDILDHN